MKKALRKTLKISGFVLGAIVILVLAAVLLVIFDKTLVRNIVQKRLGQGVGSLARIGRLDYAFSPFRISVDSLELGRDDAFQKLTVSLTRLEARGSFWKLVRGVRPALDAIEPIASLSAGAESVSKERRPREGPHSGGRYIAWSSCRDHEARLAVFPRARTSDADLALRRGRR
jgi:hypothetical protein